MKNIKGEMKLVEQEKMRSYVGVGLLILSLAFSVFFFGGFNLTFDLINNPGIVGAFKAYPNLYLNYIKEAFLFLILPPATGLAVSIIAFVKEIKHSTGIFDKFWFHLAAFGGFFFLWGALGNVWTWGSFFEAEEYLVHLMETSYGFAGIKEHVLEVYETVSVGYILWLFAGALFVFLPLFEMALRKRETSTAK